MRRNEPGFALIVVIVILLILSALSAGMVFISTEEFTIARSGEELLRARIAAESAVRARVASWGSGPYQGMEMGMVIDGAEDDGDTRVTFAIERLAGPHYLVEAHARGVNGAEAIATALVRMVGLDELWIDFPGALATAGPVMIEGEAEVHGFDPAAFEGVDESSSEYCAGVMEDLTRLFGSPLIPAIQPLPPSGGRGLRVGPLESPLIEGLADLIVGGVMELDTEDGVGYPLIYAPAGLEVSGGTGHGILLVEGDLTLSGGAEFSGLVLVRGEVRLMGSAAIHGALTIIGESNAATLDQGARITYDPCIIASTIEGTELTRRPFQPGERGWIPGF